MIDEKKLRAVAMLETLNSFETTRDQLHILREMVADLTTKNVQLRDARMVAIFSRDSAEWARLTAEIRANSETIKELNADACALAEDDARKVREALRPGKELAR